MTEFSNKQPKILRFEEKLVHLVLSGKKTSTWRLFDDKNLGIGDELILQNKDTKENFAKATITGVKDSDFAGHETYANTDEMYKAYRSYYGDNVGPSSVIKMIDFRLHD